MKKLLLAALMAGFAITANAAETLRFGMEASYPPFESIGPDNKVQGFDVDLANALCKEMQVTCEFVNQSFDSLIPSLKFKRIDAVISGMDITPERAKQVAFTKPYYDNSALFVAQKGKIADIDALNGKRVGTQNGTTHQKYMADKYKAITVSPYDSYQNAILDLKNGRLDAVFGDTAVVNEWLKQNDELSAVGEKITDADYFGTGLGIAVRSNEKERLEKLNKALDSIRENGTYESIYQKWFQ